MKKINLAITGCMGRMGQQIIKSARSDKNFNIVAITENRVINKKIGGILVEKDICANEEKTIIGIGINFNINGEENWWGDISELKIEDQRNVIIAKITSEIIKIYDKDS